MRNLANIVFRRVLESSKAGPHLEKFFMSMLLTFTTGIISDQCEGYIGCGMSIVRPVLLLLPVLFMMEPQQRALSSSSRATRDVQFFNRSNIS